MGSKNKYWAGLEALHETEDFKESVSKEFADDLSVEEFVGSADSEGLSSGRRDFLKYLGFGVGAATLAACQTPVTKVIPYVIKPDNVMPGMPTYYASTYSSGNDYASILVKTREGRPIFVKRNTQFGVGAPNARIIGSVLSLYNSERLKSPMIGGSTSTWSQVDKEIGDKLSQVAGTGKEICLLTNTVNSPSTKKLVRKFANHYSGARFNHVAHESVSLDAIPEANKVSFGTAMVPHYDFSKAKVIVSVAADFLNDWLLTTEYTPDYAKGRGVDKSWMSNHFQYESIMSVAGSNADHRFPIKPSQEGLVLASIYNQLGGNNIGVDTSAVDGMTAKAVAALQANRGSGLVVCGANDVNLQVLTNKINEALGNYGKTINKNIQVNIQGGSNAEMNGLIKRMNAGQVGAILIADSNPSYSVGSAFNEALKNVGLSVSFSQFKDETAINCQYICPDNHYMESWNDYNIKTGYYSIAQPTINKLYDTRQFQDSLLKWSGSNSDFYTYLQDNWTNNLFASQSDYNSATDFWNHVVHNSSVKLSMSNGTVMAEDDPTLSAEVSNMASVSNNDIASAIKNVSAGSEYELVLYTKTAIGGGEHANNPWMQELPDPITKACWDNYITMAPSDVEKNNFQRYLSQESHASVAKVTVDGQSVSLPVVVVPGQKSGTIGIALGYGRGADGANIGGAPYQTGERGGYLLDDQGNRKPIGANMYPFVNRANAHASYRLSNVSIEGTGDDYPMALTQTQHTVMNRHSIVRETSFDTFKNGTKEDYNPTHTLPIHEGGKVVNKPMKEIDLWDPHPVDKIGHRWGMSIDLNTCTGCSACVTACHAENNVPIVGKDEVRRGRDMHWLRIDRYFSSEATKDDSYEAQEIASENPQVVHMPMMCQHCNHAPCETVCPVAATTHSSEGLNQMTYNRCIGTRYCANNCPYKVRRFNWFNYKAYRKFTEINPAQNEMGRLVLNPDVTVRSRGVMEKCSMCVQRLQAGKLEAKIAGVPVKDGSIVTACAEACPTSAISFGDLNDKGSIVKKDSLDDRAYQAIEEVGTQPNIYYQTVVRNVKENTHA